METLKKYKYYLIPLGIAIGATLYYNKFIKNKTTSHNQKEHKSILKKYLPLTILEKLDS